MEPRTIRSTEGVLHYDNLNRNRDRSQKQLLHKGAMLIYRKLESRLYVDLRLVKRFRKWQIKVLSERICSFKRKVKRTNKAYLIKRLSIFSELILKFIAEAFTKMKNFAAPVLLPEECKTSIAACDIYAYQLKNHYLQILKSNFKIYTKKEQNTFRRKPQLFAYREENAIRRAFLRWKTCAIKTDPFYNRDILSLKSIVTLYIGQYDLRSSV